ncbi:hypothetical protein D3C81_1197070 [compost metagenome]
MAGVIEADHVDALERLAIDRGAELEHHAVAVLADKAAVVAEIAEHLVHRGQHQRDRGTAGVGRMRDRRAEHDLVGDDGVEPGHRIGGNQLVPGVERGLRGGNQRGGHCSLLKLSGRPRHAPAVMFSSMFLLYATSCIVSRKVARAAALRKPVLAPRCAEGAPQ